MGASCRLRRELVVRQRLPVAQAHERVAEHHSVLPVVVAERKFIEVTIKVLCGNLMERTDAAKKR